MIRRITRILHSFLVMALVVSAGAMSIAGVTGSSAPFFSSAPGLSFLCLADYACVMMTMLENAETRKKVENQMGLIRLPNNPAFGNGFVAMRIKLHTDTPLELPPGNKFCRYKVRTAEFLNFRVWEMKGQIGFEEPAKYLILYGLISPVWLPVMLLLAYPALRFVRGPFRRFRRRKRNQCLKCGYSLVGNLSGICPECGTVISTGAKKP